MVKFSPMITPYEQRPSEVLRSSGGTHSKAPVSVLNKFSFESFEKESRGKKNNDPSAVNQVAKLGVDKLGCVGNERKVPHGHDHSNKGRLTLSQRAQI